MVLASKPTPYGWTFRWDDEAKLFRCECNDCSGKDPAPAKAKRTRKRPTKSTPATEEKGELFK